MWLSKFSSLSSRSNPIVPRPLHESFTHAALIFLRCLDATEYVCGLGVTAAHVLVDLFPMRQAIGQHGVYVRETQRVVGLNDRLGCSATPKRLYDHLQQHAGVAYAQDARWILPEGDGDWLHGRHAGVWWACHSRGDDSVSVIPIANVRAVGVKPVVDTAAREKRSVRSCYRRGVIVTGASGPR